MTILIIGADGMIGFALYRYFELYSDCVVRGSIRSKRDLAAFGPGWQNRVFVTGSLDRDDAIRVLMENCEPSVVINCAGATAHVSEGEAPLVAIPANSLLPHRLHAAARAVGARFIHLSTDCVFDGARGNYFEADPVDAKTIYGLSKALGEVRGHADAVTIRTSPVGYELSSKRGLLAWFLSQTGDIRGFTNAYFSGLTNMQLAKVIERHFVGEPKRHGLYHVTGPRISKFDLVTKFKAQFQSPVEITPDGTLTLDRSLNGSRFRNETGEELPDWDQMIEELAAFGSAYPDTAVTRAGASLSC